MNNDADPNEPVDHKTSIMLCTFIADVNWSRSLAIQLLEYGARINLVDPLKFNALHFSAIRGRQDLLEIFLDSVDFDMNEKNCFGFTALHYLVDSEDKLDMLEILIKEMKKYQYSLDPVNVFNVTPLVESIRHLNFSAAEVMIKYGAKVDFIYGGMDFVDYISFLKTTFEKTPHYMIWKLKKSISISQNTGLLRHDSLIKSIKQTSINMAPDFDFRNNSQCVTERPKSCINVTKHTKTNDDNSWRTMMPMFLTHLEDKFTKSYRKNFSTETIILNLNLHNQEGAENTEKTGKHRNSSSKKNGIKSKMMRRGPSNLNQEKFMKRSLNDPTRSK